MNGPLTLKRKPAGFLVWNPAVRMPSVSHETYEQADTEARRLAARDPEQIFWVMAPVKGAKTASAAKAFSDGRAEGMAQAHAEIMLAEARADQAYEKVRDLERRLRVLSDLGARAEDHQAIVADCALWFDGFNAAHALSDVNPKTPDRDALRRLNGALQAVLRAQRQGDTHEDEIPF